MTENNHLPATEHRTPPQHVTRTPSRRAGFTLVETAVVVVVLAVLALVLIPAVLRADRERQVADTQAATMQPGMFIQTIEASLNEPGNARNSGAEDLTWTLQTDRGVLRGQATLLMAACLQQAVLQNDGALTLRPSTGKPLLVQVRKVSALPASGSGTPLSLLQRLQKLSPGDWQAVKFPREIQATDGNRSVQTWPGCVSILAVAQDALSRTTFQ